MNSCWKHAQRSFFLVLTALLFMVTGGPSHAANNKASLDIRQGKGFARLVLRFERPPDISSKTISTVFVIKFKKPVGVDLSRIASKLSNVVTLARRDPDGYGVRFAMTRQYKVNVMQAGNFLVVDFLASNWRGLPPGMPQDVVDELAKRAEVARLAAVERARQEALQANPLRVDVRHAIHPTFSRIQFNWNRFVTAQFTRKGDEITVLFGGKARAELAPLKINPPKNLVRIHQVQGKDSLRIVMQVSKGTPVRAFREGRNYVVDLTITKRPKLSQIEKKLYAAAKENGVDQQQLRGEEISLPGSERRAAPRQSEVQANKLAAPSGPEKNLIVKNNADDPPLPVRPKQRKKRQAQKPVTVTQSPLLSGTEPVATTEPVAQAKREIVKARSAPSAKAQTQDNVVSVKRALEPVKKTASAARNNKPRGSYNPLEEALVAQKDTKSTVDPKVIAKRQPKSGNKVDVIRNENSVQLQFPFQKNKVAAAIFQRNETLWVLIDSTKKLDIEGLERQLGGIVNNIRHQMLDKSQLLEFHLSGPWLSSVSQRASNWNISIGDLVTGSSKKIAPVKQVGSNGVEEVFVPTGAGGLLHQIKDHNSGDDLLVVTSPGPAKSLKKVHEHVEFLLFKTIHGVVVRPLSDDLRVTKNELGVKIVSRNGLFLSGNLQNVEKQPIKPRNKRRRQARKLKFDGPEVVDIKKFIRHILKLEKEIAANNGRAKRRARLKLAQHWLARGFAAEGFGLLSIAARENVEIVKNPVFRLMRGISNVMLRRYKAAEQDLGTNDLADNPHASLWRAVSAYRQKRFDRAFAEIKRGEPAIETYLPRQQALFRLTGADVAIEQKDSAFAGSELDKLPQEGITPVQSAMARFLEARLMELQNRPREALQLYADATKANIRPVTAKAVYHLTDLRLRIGEIKSAAGIGILERLSIVWRGDDVELQVLHRLADLHLEKGRYNDAFSLMDTAVKAYPSSELALALQDRMKAHFVELFLRGKADDLSPVKALALFYDHKHLTPPGRLGDEMIRRLADRLINVDLLDKAADLLEHQVTRRLKGAGRAQVAIRLAMIHLLQHRPKLALKTIYRTRQPNLPAQVHEARKLLEARAYAELGRSGPALELLETDDSLEAGEIKSLALWNGQKWTKAGEQYEKVLGNEWQSSDPLSSKKRVQVLRAAISYTLGGDQLGVDRLRDKYGSKMAKGSDAEAFAMITDPLKSNARTVDKLARDIADIDTLEAFIQVFRQRLSKNGAPQTTSTVK